MIYTVESGRPTGSADKVANLTPFFCKSLYFRASRPISVVQTGCETQETFQRQSVIGKIGLSRKQASVARSLQSMHQHCRLSDVLTAYCKVRRM